MDQGGWTGWNQIEWNWSQFAEIDDNGFKQEKTQMKIATFCHKR